MKKKSLRIVSIVLCVVMTAALLTACGKSDGKGLSGSVNTNGSTSMEKVMGILIESFTETNKDVVVNYTGAGSGAGITAAIDKTADLGLSSRELKDEETSKGAVAHIIALDGIAIIVNPANPLTDLSLSEIAKLATGEAKNWKDIGGSDAPVAFIGRESGSGTRSAFEELLKVQDKCVYENEQTSTGDVLANVASNPNAIGYISLSSVNNTIKALKVEGIEATEAAVLDGSYPIQRPFVIVTNKDVKLSAAAQAFLDFALSKDAAPLITKAGAIPPAK